MANDRHVREERDRDDEAERPQRGSEPSPDRDRDREEEAEPVADEPGRKLGDLDAVLDDHEYPATTEELIEAYGDREVESRDGTASVGELLESVGDERYESAEDVRRRLQGLLHR